jgi:hypothetical protein
MLDELYMRDLANAMRMPEEVVPAGTVTVSAPEPEMAGMDKAFVGTRLNVPKPGQPTEQDREKMAIGLLDTLAGALRGAAAQVGGLPGDIRSILDMINQEGAEKYLGQRSFATTEEILADTSVRIPGTQIDVPFPPVLKEGVPNRAERQGAVETAQEVGTFLPAPGIPEAAIQGTKAVIKGAKALGPKAAQMSEDYLRSIGGIADITPASPKMGAVKPGDELIVQHNLTAEKLISADKLGGMPVPSLAISKAATPLQNFGEITLIGSKEMATPSAKNPVFQTDAYTKKKPGITYSIDDKSAKNLDALFSDIKDKVPNYNSERYSLIDNIEDISRNRLMQAKFLEQKGLLPDIKEFEKSYQFEGEVRSIVDKNRNEYENFVNDFKESLPSLGVEIKEKLFKGFTYAGNRIYRDANLQNIVSAMKGGAGSEGINYGVGNLRAVATPKFKTFNQVKSSRSKIIGESAMSDVKNQADSAYQNLLGRLYDINSKYDASDAILEVAETRSMSNLDKIYGDKLPQELKADIGIFINKLKDLPAAYFEIKPQRSVNIGEFKGAIIPKDTPKKARDVLEKNGITEIYEYSTPDERKALFQKYGKEMFSVAPAIPAAATQEENK